MAALHLHLRVDWLTLCFPYNQDVMITIVLKFLKKVLKNEVGTWSGRERRRCEGTRNSLFSIYNLRVKAAANAEAGRETQN